MEEELTMSTGDLTWAYYNMRFKLNIKHDLYVDKKRKLELMEKSIKEEKEALFNLRICALANDPECISRADPYQDKC